MERHRGEAPVEVLGFADPEWICQTQYSGLGAEAMARCLAISYLLFTYRHMLGELFTAVPRHPHRLVPMEERSPTGELYW